MHGPWLHSPSKSREAELEGGGRETERVSRMQTGTSQPAHPAVARWCRLLPALAGTCPPTSHHLSLLPQDEAVQGKHLPRNAETLGMAE